MSDMGLLSKMKDINPGEVWGDPPLDQACVVRQVGTVSVAEALINYAMQIGYTLHTIRGGITVGLGHSDAGYILVFTKAS